MKRIAWIARLVICLAAGVIVPFLVMQLPLDYYLLPPMPTWSPQSSLAEGLLFGFFGGVLLFALVSLIGWRSGRWLPAIMAAIGCAAFGLWYLPTLQPIPSGNPSWFDYARLGLIVVGPAIGAGLAHMATSRKPVPLTSAST